MFFAEDLADLQAQRGTQSFLLLAGVGVIHPWTN
jgi:hypothetical protein